MSDKQLKRAIHQIAEHDIGDDMNRWNEIYAQLDLPKTRMIQRLSRMVAMVALLTVGLMVTGLTALAVYRLAQRDGGLQAVNEAGLTTELNLSQTQGDVTVTVERAYADSTRVAVWFTVEGMEFPEGALLEMFFEPVLEYANGDFFPLTGQSMEIDYSQDVQGYIMTVQHDEVIPEDQVYSLRLVLRPTPNGARFQPFEGEPIQVNLPTEFSFNFELPVGEPLIIEPELSVESAGLTVTLNRLEIAPSATKLEVCHDNLYPTAQLGMTIRFDDGEAIPLISWNLGSKSASFDAPIRCWEVSFPIASVEKPESIEVVMWLSQNFPEGISEIPPAGVETLAELGIVGRVEAVDGGFSISVVSKPDDMDQQTALQLISQNLNPRYDGEWVFRVALTE